jgi:phosphatidylinositol glycan class V
MHKGDLLAVKATLCAKLAFGMLSLAAGWTVSPYDTSAALGSSCSSALYPLAERWDALWMAKAARCGYVHEQQLAFFPAFPLLAHSASFGLCPEIGGVLLAFVCQVACAPLVCSTARVASGNSNRVAAHASAAWALNPAMPFFSSAYADAPFALLAFACMRLAMSEHIVLAAITALCGASLRSNGALLAAPLVACVIAGVRRRGLRRLKGVEVVKYILWLLCALSPALPSLLFQLYAVRLFCGESDWKQQPMWCPKESMGLLSLSLPYKYVQGRYWGLGFLSFWQLEQLPNIALGLPAIVITANALLEAVYFYPLTMFTLGAFGDPSRKSQSHSTISEAEADAQAHVRHAAIIGVTAAWGVMGAAGALVMHVQVSTRMMSAWPPCIWYVARRAASSERFAMRLHIFCGTYAAVGSVLFATFYPWT